MNFKFSPEKKKVNSESFNEQDFYPGKLSGEGFLAAGEKLGEVIERDRVTCDLLGITSRQIGEAIEEILKGGIKHKFEVQIESWRGMQLCPFDKSMAPFSNTDFTITNKKTGKSFKGPGLIAHLLKEHSFFEGDTAYRVEPEKAIEVLFEKTAEAK